MQLGALVDTTLDEGTVIHVFTADGDFCGLCTSQQTTLERRNMLSGYLEYDVVSLGISFDGEVPRLSAVIS